ncbi:MAG: hypothetical protein ACREMY_06120 [bacterium]
MDSKIGVQRGLWNLAWDGSEMIPKGVLDSGYLCIGPEAVPGNHTRSLDERAKPLIESSKAHAGRQGCLR